MVKPLIMTIAVEEASFGKVYRLLDNMPGVASIALASEYKDPKASRSRQKSGGTQSVMCLILGALIKSPGLSRAQLAPIIEGAGKKASSMPDALAKLAKAGEIRSSGRGTKGVTYKITSAGKKRYDTACVIENGGEA